MERAEQLAHGANGFSSPNHTTQLTTEVESGQTAIDSVSSHALPVGKVLIEVERLGGHEELVSLLEYLDRQATHFLDTS